MLGPTPLFAMVMLAAGAASVSLTPLFADAHSPRTAELVETTVGTTVFCASIGLIFHRYGPIAGAVALLTAWLVNRGLAHLERSPFNRVCPWAAAAALLLYLSRT